MSSLNNAEDIVPPFRDSIEATEDIYVVTCDGHPNLELRDIHKSNVIILLYATAIDIALLVFYFQSWPIIVFGLFCSLVPILMNYAWLVLSYELKLKSIRSSNAITVFIIALSLIAVFQFGMFIFLCITVFSGGLSQSSASSYQMGSMWISENFFFTSTCLLNVAQLYTFIRHVYTYRKFINEKLVLHKV